MEDSDDSMDYESTPADEAPDRVTLIPEKSKMRYEQTYQQFTEWCQRKNVENISELLVIEYFAEKAKTLKPPTLWVLYSMLKSTLILKAEVDISKYRKLIIYLKRKNKGYRPQKRKTLTREQLHFFLRGADDEDFLMMKVAVIFGITGACRRMELTNMMIDHIEDKETHLVVIIPDSGGRIQRIFSVTEGDLEGVNFLQIYRKYVTLRPLHINHNRLFLNYKKGKCSTQAVGKNTLGKLPKMVADYLGLPNSAEYTGHCLRNSSASLMTNAGTDMIRTHPFVRQMPPSQTYFTN